MRATATSPACCNEDIKVREYLKKKLKNASVGRVIIERPAKNARITIYSVASGRRHRQEGRGHRVAEGRAAASCMGVPVHVNIEEIRKPEIDAQLIADSIAQQLEKRIMFRRAMKRAMQNAMRLGAQGIKIMSVRPSERHRDRAYASGIAKVACRCIRCAPISTTASAKRRRPTASSASRSGSSRATCWRATTHCGRRTEADAKKGVRSRPPERVRAAGRDESTATPSDAAAKAEAAAGRREQARRSSSACKALALGAAR